MTLKIVSISIHAPAKGATVTAATVLALKEFQSTLPRRERQNRFAVISGADTISIHAPAKGATHSSDNGDSVTCISIHAPAKGATRGVITGL